MKKTLFTMLFSLLLPTGVSALDVTCVPGSLSEQVTDTGITRLNITGTVDVRDFAFIAGNLPNLTSIDMSSVAIDAYTCCGNESYFSCRGTFDADELPQYSFFGSRLQDVKLPATLRSVGEAAFAGCEALQAVVIPASVDAIGANAFNASGLLNVKVDSRVIGEAAFAGCPDLASVEIGKNVASIGKGSFSGCDNLTSVVLAEDNALQYIGDEAFMGTALQRFDFSLCHNVESVGKWSFAGTKLSIAELPEGITEVPEGVFFGNEPTVYIPMPNSVENIGDYAYYGNSSHNASLKIPADVTYIGDNAFEGVKPSYVIASPLNVPELGKEVFEGMNNGSRTVLYVDEASIPDYQSAAQWSDFDIRDVAGTETVTIDGDITVNVRFDDDMLHISASDEIEAVSLYDESGLLYAAVAVSACDAALDTSAISKGVVIAAVKLSGDAAPRIFKLMRHR